ncbi:MAG: translation initiation factor [Bacteroidetes bacterium]|nr:translation initiation factor [Bacteroidota bacterium]
MPKKPNKTTPDSRGMVYSTNPSFSFEPEQKSEQPFVEPAKQRLIVRIDRKQRGGKEVTLVEGFQGPDSALQALGKLLKTQCGTGGSAKDGEILVQGDVRDKVVAALLKAGYNAKRGN